MATRAFFSLFPERLVGCLLKFAHIQTGPFPICAAQPRSRWPRPRLGRRRCDVAVLMRQLGPTWSGGVLCSIARAGATYDALSTSQCAAGERSPIWRPVRTRMPGASAVNREHHGVSCLIRFSSGLRQPAPAVSGRQPVSTGRVARTCHIAPVRENACGSLWGACGTRADQQSVPVHVHESHISLIACTNELLRPVYPSWPPLAITTC